MAGIDLQPDPNNIARKKRTYLCDSLKAMLTAVLIASSGLDHGIEHAYSGSVSDELKGTDRGQRYLLDSGASGHFCNDISLFKSLRTSGNHS